MVDVVIYVCWLHMVAIPVLVQLVLYCYLMVKHVEMVSIISLKDFPPIHEIASDCFHIYFLGTEKSCPTLSHIFQMTRMIN